MGPGRKWRSRDENGEGIEVELREGRKWEARQVERRWRHGVKNHWENNSVLAVQTSHRLWTHWLTRDVPCPARADKEVSWCGWWSRKEMAAETGPRHWPEWRRSSQAGCGRSDRSAQTRWPLWTQCGWRLQTTLQHLYGREVNQREMIFFFHLGSLQTVQMCAAHHCKTSNPNFERDFLQDVFVIHNI